MTKDQTIAAPLNLVGLSRIFIKDQVIRNLDLGDQSVKKLPEL